MSDVVVLTCLVEVGFTLDSSVAIRIRDSRAESIDQELAVSESRRKDERAAADLVDLAHFAEVANIQITESMRETTRKIDRALADEADSLRAALSKFYGSDVRFGKKPEGSPQSIPDAYYWSLTQPADAKWLDRTVQSMAKQSVLDIDPLQFTLVSLMANRLLGGQRVGTLFQDLHELNQRFLEGLSDSEGWINESVSVQGSVEATYVAALTAQLKGLTVRNPSIARAVRQADTRDDTVAQITASVAEALVNDGSEVVLSGEAGRFIREFPSGSVIANPNAVILAVLYRNAGGNPIGNDDALASVGSDDSATQQVARWIMTGGRLKIASDAGSAQRLLSIAQNHDVWSSERYLAIAAASTHPAVAVDVANDILRQIDSEASGCGYPDWMARASNQDATCDLRASLSAAVARAIIQKKDSVLRPVVRVDSPQRK